MVLFLMGMRRPSGLRSSGSFIGTSAMSRLLNGRGCDKHGLAWVLVLGANGKRTRSRIYAHPAA